MFTTTLSAQAVFTAANNAAQRAHLYSITADAQTEPYPFNGEGEWFTITHKAEPSRRYKVTLPNRSESYPEGKCNCPAWEKSGVCLHVYICDAHAEEAAAVETFEKEMEAREFMMEASREHNIGFTAEVYDDVAGAFPA